MQLKQTSRQEGEREREGETVQKYSGKVTTWDKINSYFFLSFHCKYESQHYYVKMTIKHAVGKDTFMQTLVRSHCVIAGPHPSYISCPGLVGEP